MRYINHLTLDIPPIKQGFRFPPTESIINKNSWHLYPKYNVESVCNQDLLKFLSDLELVPVPKCLLFFVPSKKYLTIHSDGDGNPNIWALNWSLSKTNPYMTWYNPISEGHNSTVNTATTPTTFIQYSPEQVRQVHQEVILSPSLVNIGVPHGGYNHTDEDAWLLSLRFKNKLTIDQVYNLFKHHQLV
jgi:hypothetical protein